jgi:hypothetical protein
MGFTSGKTMSQLEALAVLFAGLGLIAGSYVAGIISFALIPGITLGLVFGAFATYSGLKRLGLL